MNQYEKIASVTEARLRSEENINPDYKRANASYYAKPISEGRMRIPEIHPQKSNSSSLTSNTYTKATALNPFEDEYDESKNPFADELEYDESKNPFETS